MIDTSAMKKKRAGDVRNGHAKQVTLHLRRERSERAVGLSGSFQVEAASLPRG